MLHVLLVVTIILLSEFRTECYVICEQFSRQLQSPIMWTIVVALLVILVIFCIKVSIVFILKTSSSLKFNLSFFEGINSTEQFSSWSSLPRLDRIPTLFGCQKPLPLLHQPLPEVRRHLLHLCWHKTRGGPQQLDPHF